MSNPSEPNATERDGDVPEVEFRRLFDLSLDLMCVAGLDGYFKHVNPSWTRVLGWTEAELLERPVAEFMHPDDRERTLAARALLARGVPVRGLENRYLCKHGGYRWLAWQSSVDLGAGRVYAVARDVTDRRHREQQRLVYSKLESAGILAGGIAHDFNNLLAALLLSVDMVQIVGEVNPEQEGYLAKAKECVHSARGLTHQLLEFAAGETPEQLPLDVRLLLPDACRLALQGSNVTAEFDFEADLWRVAADALQISSVMTGLVLNAREAEPKGGKVLVSAHNVMLGPDRVGVCRPGPFVCVSISDDGHGMSNEVVLRVFDPYFSTKPRGARKGMGLSLAICRSVLQRHGGDVELESQLGKGTVMRCYLPAVAEKGGAGV